MRFYTFFGEEVDLVKYPQLAFGLYMGGGGGGGNGGGDGDGDDDEEEDTGIGFDDSDFSYGGGSSSTGSSDTTSGDGGDSVDDYLGGGYSDIKDSRESNTGFDLGGEYVDNETTSEWGNYVDANEHLNDFFNDYNQKYEDNLREGMDDDEAADKAYEDTKADQREQMIAEMNKRQRTYGDIAKAGVLLDPTGTTTLVGLTLGLVSQAKENNFDDEDMFNELFARAKDKADAGKSITGEDVEEIFGLDPGEGEEWIEEGSKRGQDIITSLPPDEVAEMVSGEGALGSTPFSEAGSPLQDLYDVIGGPMTGAELPPAYEQYRQDLLGARIAEIESILPELQAYNREKGIGAYGGLTSAYRGLVEGSNRRIADTVRTAQLETGAQALDAYTKGRVAEADIALGERGQLIDYLRGTEIAKIGAKASTDVAGAQMDASKYGALGEIVFGIYDRYTGS